MPVPEEHGCVDRPLLRDSAYAALCDAIVGGTLSPGERIHDAQLCRWLGLSRTPIREALSRLEEEGLIETAPQRFTRVTELDPRVARDVFGVLAVLHSLATEQAVPRLGREDVQRLRKHNREFHAALLAGDAEASYAADDAFHDVFVEASDNAEIVRALGHLVPNQQRLERLRTGALPGRRSVAQHEAIADRTHVGDALGAASAARENWLTLGALVERTLAPPPSATA
jgi:DNA-binding GntR family transcriptional regulator